jgi:hypothetical protein
MSICGISQQDQTNLLTIVAGVLHLGNIQFREQDHFSTVADDNCMYRPFHRPFLLCIVLAFPAFLVRVWKSFAVTHRRLAWGRPKNVEAKITKVCYYDYFEPG